MIANDCLGVIFQRVSVQKMAILWDYSQEWFSYGDELPLRRTAAQLFGLVIDHRPNFVQRDRANNLFDSFASTINNLNKDIGSNKGYCNGDADWEFSYFCLVSFEKLYKICQRNEHDKYFEKCCSQSPLGIICCLKNNISTSFYVPTYRFDSESTRE